MWVSFDIEEASTSFSRKIVFASLPLRRKSRLEENFSSFRSNFEQVFPALFKKVDLAGIRIIKKSGE